MSKDLRTSFRAPHYAVVVIAALFLYLIIVTIFSLVLVISNFPSIVDEVIVFPARLTDDRFQLLPFGLEVTREQGVLLLASFSGVIGSFIHAAQSLGTFVGNRTFRTSWTVWYLFRPWIGAVLAISIYVVFSAGLVGGAKSLNPAGIVAVGILAGWFSKVAADKLEEVFETLFRTDADDDRKDKPLPSENIEVDRIEPATISSGAKKLKISGKGLLLAVEFRLDDRVIPHVLNSDSEILLDIQSLSPRQPAGTTSSIYARSKDRNWFQVASVDWL